MAEIDATTGLVTDWNPMIPGPAVYSIVPDGSSSRHRPLYRFQNWTASPDCRWIGARMPMAGWYSIVFYGNSVFCRVAVSLKSAELPGKASQN